MPISECILTSSASSAWNRWSLRLLQVQARKKSDEHENCPFHHHEAGTWGIDRAADVVWAVLQHNSQFAAFPGQLPAPPTDYASWKTLNFSEAERGDVAISGPEADPDGDGLGNIQEYAFLTAPRRFSPNPVTGSITQAGDSPPYLTITYKRRKGTSGRLILGSCPSLVPTLRILPWVSTCPRSTILMAAKPLLTGITPHSRISWGVVLPAFGLALRRGKQSASRWVLIHFGCVFSNFRVSLSGVIQSPR